MGMGNYAAFAEVVKQEFVEKTCPEEFQELLNIIDLVDDMFLTDLAKCAQYPEDIEGELTTKCSIDDAHKIYEAYNKLCNKFLEKTHLSLYINYHEAEDRGDEVNGMFWCVDGVYQLSHAGKKYQKEIERKFWTNFG